LPLFYHKHSRFCLTAFLSLENQYFRERSGWKLYSFFFRLAKYYLLLFQDYPLLPPHYCPTSSLILCHVGYSSTIKMETADSSKHWYLSTNLLSVTSDQTVIFIVLICYCPFQVCQLCHRFGLISYICILIVICTLAKRYTHTVSDLRIYFYRVNIMQAVNRFSTCLLDHIKTYKRLTIKSLDIQDKHLFPRGNCIPHSSFSKQLAAIS